MPHIELEGAAQPLRVYSWDARVHSSSSTTAVNSGMAPTGLTAVFSLGKGFRDFILRGTVVELAVAVVLGTAFSSLLESVTKDFITPVIAAIFAGSNFSELYFQINSSQFRYGDFINAFITFLFVIAALYFCVVVPLQKLQFAAFKLKATMRDCPFCYEEISMAATRCKHCCGDVPVNVPMRDCPFCLEEIPLAAVRCKHCSAEVPLTEEMQRTLGLATAALDAEAARHRNKWYQRMFAPCTRCCCKPQTAVVQESGDSVATLSTEHGVVLASPLWHSMSGTGSGVLQRDGSQQGSAYVSAVQSFIRLAPVSTTIDTSTTIDIEQLEQLQDTDR